VTVIKIPQIIQSTSENKPANRLPFNNTETGSDFSMLLDMLIKQAKHSNLSLKAKGSNISTCGDNISDFIPNSGSEEPAQDNQGTVNEKIEGLLPDNSQRNKEILGNFQKLLLEVFDNYQGALEGQEENPLLQLKKLMLTTDEPTSSTLTPSDNSKENTAIIDGKPGTGLQPASESAAVSEKASGSNGKQSNSTPAAGMQASRSVKGDAANPKTGPEQAPPTLKEEAAAPKITAEQNLHSMKGNTAYNKAVPAPTTVSPNNEAAGLRTDSTAGNNTPGSTQAGRGVVTGGEKQVVSSNQTAQPAGDSAAVSDKASGNGKQSNSEPAAVNIKTGTQSPQIVKGDSADPKTAGLRTDSTTGNNTPGSAQAGRGVVPGGEKQVVSSNQTAQPAGNSAAVSDKASSNGKQSNSEPAAVNIKAGIQSPQIMKGDSADPKTAGLRTDSTTGNNTPGSTHAGRGVVPGGEKQVVSSNQTAQPAGDSAAVSDKPSGNGKQSNSEPAAVNIKAGTQSPQIMKGDSADPKTAGLRTDSTTGNNTPGSTHAGRGVVTGGEKQVVSSNQTAQPAGNSAAVSDKPSSNGKQSNSEPAAVNIKAGTQSPQIMKGDSADPKTAGLRTDSTTGNNTPGSTQAGRGVVPGGEKQVVSSNQTAQPAGNSAAVSDKPSGNGKQSNSTPAANDIKTGMHSPHTLKVDTAAPKIAAAPVTGPSNNEVAGQKMGFPANNAAPGAGQTDTEKQATFDLEISRKVNPVAAKQYNEGNLPGQKEANFTPSRGQSGPDRILGSSGTDQQARSLQGSNPPKNQEQPNLIKNETSINPLQAHIVKSDAASTVNTGQNITQSAQMAARLASAIQQTVINKDGTASLRIKLKPEHLGEVTIRLVYNQGNLQAHFMATHMHTRDMLEHSMGLLKENLSQMNINLTDASTSSSDDGGKPGENQPGEKHWYKPKKEEESFSFHESTEDMPEAESSPGVKTGVLNKLI
jgi:flagellar hook-length control protein FliK